MEQVTNIVIRRWGARAVLLDQARGQALAQAMDQALALATMQAGEVSKSTHV
jgi:hypothetical protein